MLRAAVMHRYFKDSIRSSSLTRNLLSLFLADTERRYENISTRVSQQRKQPVPHNQHEHAPFGHLPDEGLVTLHIDCAAEDAGWIVTYDGAYPHTGSISGARPGAKVLMQVGDRADLDTKIEEYDFSILLLCSGQVFGF